MPKDGMSRPLLSGLLSPRQWAILGELHHEMRREYTLRREMLLKRLDVTVQSFKVKKIGHSAAFSVHFDQLFPAVVRPS